MKKKHIALLLTCVMLMGVAIGGTLAWLTAETGAVTNTFTVSGIEIELDEGVDVGTKGEESFKMVPGWSIKKDPMVTVKAGSEDCYVFVKIDMSDNYSSYLEAYDVDDAWTPLMNDNGTPDTEDDVAEAGVFYQIVDEADWATVEEGKDWSDYVLDGKGTEAFANGFVTVKGGVTMEMMKALTAETYPTLTFTAYASQLMQDNTTEFSPYAAWTNAASANP